jgi:DNA-binding transcriptional LysR family regulator
MEMEWDDLRTVLAVVRQGTLAAAGEVLGVNYTTVARRIARAEARSGRRLFDRLPGGYVPTEAAQAVARRAAAMEAEAAALDRALAQGDRTLEGRFVVTVPQLLIGPILAEGFARFTALYPGIELVVRSTNDLLNLNSREADIAIRISDNPGEALVGRRLARQETAAFAAPGLARRIEEAPDAPVEWIGFTFWKRPPKASLELRPGGRIKLRFDDMVAVVGAAQQGLGVARMPMFLGRYAGLEQVPVMPPQPYADIWVVSHRDLSQAPRQRAFKQVITPLFAERRAMFVAASR